MHTPPTSAIEELFVQFQRFMQGQNATVVPPVQPAPTVSEESATTAVSAAPTTTVEAAPTTTLALSPQEALVQFQALFNQMTNRPNALVFQTRPPQPIQNPQRVASNNVATVARPLNVVNPNTQPAPSSRNQRNLQTHSGQENTPTQPTTKRGRKPFPRDDNGNIIRPPGWAPPEKRKKLNTAAITEDIEEENMQEDD